jgi:transposase-like protein
MANRTSYTNEEKQQILERLQAPENESVSALSGELDIPKSTIYSWIRKARKQGRVIPNNRSKPSSKWNKNDKVKIVMETYTMNEEELSRYCRENGLYKDTIKQWQELMEGAFDASKKSPELIEATKKNSELEKELRYKDKALAEAAALLVLRKKVKAIWGDPEEE